MEVLRLASAYVDVPAGDLSAGIARNRVAPDAKWLQIRNSASEPERAWLKIKRSGSWYYIAGHGLVRPSHGWCDRDRP